MKRRTKMMMSISVLMTATLMAGLAYAGARWDDGGAPSVFVDPVGRSASGSLGAARNSSNSVEYARCSAVTFADGWAVASCEFVTSNNTYGSCYSTDPEVMQMVAGMASDSRVSVTWSASTGECVYIQFEKASHLAPKSH